MYFSSPEELKRIVPLTEDGWSKEYLYEYLVWSCHSAFEDYIDDFFSKHTDDDELAELLFSFLLDEHYDGSDCQMGAAYYIAKLDRELLRKKKELLLQAQSSDVHWKRPFRTDEYPEWLNQQ
ncbi:MAG: hypothetical protein E7559_08890 [Ruminococcaceae bacterium]|nr:hypothetical protein [Oscillospiraceae bacterium]